MDDDIKPTINTTPPPTTTSTTSTTSNSATAPNAPSDPNGGSSTAATGKRYRAAPAKTFACRGYGECRMVFSRSEHLARHVRKHTGERPFQCHCGKQFSRLDNLRQHAQTVHADKQDQNERMMRELTSLHTSMSASAKRDGRRKAAESRAIGAVNPGLPPHPSLQHPSLMQGHSMVQSPIGMAPGYPSPTGQGMPTHMSGHMHAQSMSAAIGHTPGYHDAVPSARYGRGRPGTSAGYEGGFDPHNAYDPRRWPHAGPPPGSGAQHPSLGGWHGDASAVAGFGTSSPTTAHHPSNTTPSHPYPTPDESNAGFREGGFHRPPVPVAAPAQAPSQTTTSSSSTSQPHPQAPQASQAAQAAQAQAHPGQSTRDPQAQALGFRDGSGLGFRQQQHHPNTPNSSSSSNGQAAGFGLNSNNSNNNNHNNSGMGNSTSSADMTGLPTEQGFRDTGGTSSSFRDGSFRGDAGAGGSYGRDAPRYDDDDDDEREDDEARGDRGGDDRMDTDVPPSAPDEPLHRRHGDEYDDESRPGAYGGSFRRAADARFYARPPPADGRYPRSPTPDSPAPRDAPQPRPFAESQPGRYEQPRARAEYERPPGAYYAGEREYGPAPTARDRDGYGYGYGYDRYRDAYGYADRPSSSYARGAESPPSSTSSAGTATYYAREREHERSPPASRRTGTASGVLLPDAFAFAGRPGTAPAAYASGYGGSGGGGGLGRRLGAEPSSPTGYNDSPFSFHPPGLGGPPPTGAYASPTPATSSQSTASAASLHAHALAGPGVAPASSSRKRAAPDSDFDAVERTRPGTGYQQQRPTTGSASRPQSRRLSVMELCHDEDARPPTSGGGGERAGFARTQRLLPVSSSRPGTSGGDGHLVSFFRRPDTASGRGDYGYGHGHGGGGGRPDTAGGSGRPGSSGSPFAFAHPGDVAAVRLSPDAPATAAAARSGGDATGNSSGSSTPGRRLLPSPSGGSGGKKSSSITPRASASVSPVLSAGAGASPPLSAARAEGIVGVAKGSPGVRV